MSGSVTFDKLSFGTLSPHFSGDYVPPLLNGKYSLPFRQSVPVKKRTSYYNAGGSFNAGGTILSIMIPTAFSTVVNTLLTAFITTFGSSVLAYFLMYS